MTSNPFPLSIVEKVNSPALLAWFQQFGEQGYVSADDANKYTQALRFLYENMAIATLRRPTRFIEPPTASMIVGDENNSVVVVGDADSVITLPAGIYPIDAQLEITSLSDAVTHVNFPGGSSTGYSDIPFGATLVMKQIELNYWVCNFRFVNTGSYAPVTLTNILGAGDRIVVNKNSDHLLLPTDHTVQLVSIGDMDYFFNNSVSYPIGSNILIKPGAFAVRIYGSANHQIILNGDSYISAPIDLPNHVNARLNKINTTDWVLTFEYGFINTAIPTFQQVVNQGGSSIDTGILFTSGDRNLSLEPEIGLSFSSEFYSGNFGFDSATFVDNFSSNFSRFGLSGWQRRTGSFDSNVFFETPTQNNNINFPNKSGILVVESDLTGLGIQTLGDILAYDGSTNNTGIYSPNGLGECFIFDDKSEMKFDSSSVKCEDSYVTITALDTVNVYGNSFRYNDIEVATMDYLTLKADLVDGVVPSSQLPSYVDDVLEYANLAAFPGTGQSGKIYLAVDTNKSYRWSGSTYVHLDDSIALGTTSATAFRGDWGFTAYEHSQITSGNPHGITTTMIGAEASSNKENTTLDNSTSKYPTVNLLKVNLDLKATIDNPTFTGTITSPAIILSSETANTIAYFDASKNLKSLSTSSYPSLSELSYVKGVTSAIQTQIDSKADIDAPSFSGLITGSGTTLTGSSSTGVLSLIQTWNTTGNPTALKLNVTNTASGSTSLLFDFQVNGVSLGRLTKTGILTVGNGMNAGSGAVQGSFFATSGSVFNFGNNYMYGASGTATVATSGTKSVFLADFSWSPTSGTSDINIFNASPTINQTGGATGKVRGFYFNPTLTAAADAIGIDIQKGRLVFSTTNTASGTTGNQTINKISGTVNFAAGASSLVVTNNLATTDSIIIPVVYGNDATGTSARITRANGSFTITLNAAATSETVVSFFIFN